MLNCNNTEIVNAHGYEVSMVVGTEVDESSTTGHHLSGFIAM